MQEKEKPPEPVQESKIAEAAPPEPFKPSEEKIEEKAVPAERKPEAKPAEKKAQDVPVQKKPGEMPPGFPAQQSAQSQKKSILESVAGIFSHKKQAEIQAADISRLERKATDERKEMAPKIGIGTTLKSIFSSEITIGESEVSDLLEELELSLLESDVAYDVALEVVQQLRKELVGLKVPKGEVEKRTRGKIASILESVMYSERKFSLVERVKGMQKPAKILFVGPNGAGKTTTMAKVARLLLDNGLTVVFSASDTFRAAAIEQTEVHAARLGVKAIKSKYGADPASVAFDAINYATSHSIDVVLIDSAGRQDTNANLLLELKKIVRISKPDLKIYIGESIGGNAVIEQIKGFNEAIGIDGAILTKIDCDAKGGTAISVAKATGAPVLFLGVGQDYADLEPFDPHKIAEEIMA